MCVWPTDTTSPSYPHRIPEMVQTITSIPDITPAHIAHILPSLNAKTAFQKYNEHVLPLKKHNGQRIFMKTQKVESVFNLPLQTV